MPGLKETHRPLTVDELSAVHPFEVHTIYGGNEAPRSLIRHQKDLGLAPGEIWLLDFLFNHDDDILDDGRVFDLTGVAPRMTKRIRESLAAKGDVTFTPMPFPKHPDAWRFDTSPIMERLIAILTERRRAYYEQETARGITSWRRIAS